MPAFLIALHWPGLKTGPALSGIVAGTLFSVTLTFSDVTRLGGVHVGLVGCGVNIVVACLLSLLVRERADPASSAQPKC